MQAMFRDVIYRNTLLSILDSTKSKPLEWWSKKVHARRGHIKRRIDKDLDSLVLELMCMKTITTFIHCPRDPMESLYLRQPYLIMVVKNLRRSLTFEIQIIDDQDLRRHFRISTRHLRTTIKPLLCMMPLRLTNGWNRIQLDLENLTRRAFGTRYTRTLRMQIHANCRIRLVYFADRIYTDEELPENFKVFLPETQPAK